MTINRRWIAREWLYLLAGFVWAYVLFPIVVPPLARRLYGPASLALAPLVGFGPYAIFQVVRITRWAIRTLREAE